MQKNQLDSQASYYFYLCQMLKIPALLLTGMLWFTQGTAQVSYLDRPDLLEQVESCLQFTYNFSFEEARMLQHLLAETTPEHPAPDFLEALIVYWENFPLTPSDKASEQFIHLMDRVIAKAKIYTEKDKTMLEGTFFDLYGRALKAMFWADNGKPMKIVPDLRNMYRYTKEGFILKDQFIEFYFSTGLYNYYIEAYPEAHPVYKPLLSFMMEGNRQLGLDQLNYAIHHAVYLKVESMLFMSLIQLKYEKDLKSAALYAEKLYQEYPRNIYYQGHLLTILLYQHRYQRSREVLDHMKNQHDSYSEMIKTMGLAFLAEHSSADPKLVEQKYFRVIRMTDKFGTFADLFKGISYMGLSRLRERQGLQGDANKFARKASHYTSYSFILSE